MKSRDMLAVVLFVACEFRGWVTLKKRFFQLPPIKCDDLQCSYLGTRMRADLFSYKIDFVLWQQKNVVSICRLVGKRKKGRMLSFAFA
eukprot:scaffold2473_cov214-Chaetoceros_neogracile.AAC.38